jgi:hypothetical protein
VPDEKQPDDDKTEPEAEGGDAEVAPAEEGAAAEGAAAGGDKFRPEAIAERVGAIGEETDIDRLAREEEAKLTERKKKAKKGKKGGGLESAASKRLARIGEGKVKRPSAGRAASAVSMESDPLLDRTVRLGQWIKEHQQVFGMVVAAALLAGGGLLGWTYWQGKRDADASALLATGFADERGAVTASKDEDEEEDDGKQAPLYPTFKTPAARQEAALAAYRKVEAKYAGTGAAILARLSEAGVLLDQADAKGARAAYEDVKGSPLAAADAQVRGRALEGIGFADELLAQTDGDANKDQHLDAALSAYKQLEQIDLKGFKELGMYHEARVLQAKGDKAKAVELLKDVAKRVGEPGESHPFAYLQSVAEDRLRDLDPSALPPKPAGGGPMGMGRGGPGGPGGAGGKGGPDMNDPRVREIMRQLEEQMKQKGGGEGLPLPIPGPSK